MPRAHTLSPGLHASHVLSLIGSSFTGAFNNIGFLANPAKRVSPVKVRVSEIVVSTFCKTADIALNTDREIRYREKHTTT
jgi:hypothetical protein